ncbi:Histone-lysine N-methyltransferase EZH1 [Colletotrichum sidae]|uniref:Histone-lysine N-methyltransferase EZH1 n=1 Tax=Colletotrichum sidae TaxID=1347389 RepID=A0A4R8TUB9_9PEZI|nr:Histone-lysine N-methyltransferase EZH1 [Colletotrichum sidae]
MSQISGSDRDRDLGRLDTSQGSPFAELSYAAQYFRRETSQDRPSHRHMGSKTTPIDLTLESSPDRSVSHPYKSETFARKSSFPPDDGPALTATILSEPGASTAVSSNEPSVLDPSPPPVSAPTSVDLDEMPRPLKTPQQMTPPSSTRPSTHRSPKNASASKKQTPNRGSASVSDFSQLTAQLKELSKDIRKTHEELCVYALKSAQPVDTRIKTGVDFFAEMVPKPVAEVKGTTMKIRMKQHFRGRKSDQGKDSHFMPVCVVSNKDAVPKYRFHHTEIVKNVLSPNSMLKFVPVIRDLEAHEERDYLLWLKELERMDASCGFQTLGSRDQRVARTVRKERTATLSIFLDAWLKKIALENCNRNTLIRHMASSESDDAMTPQQKTSLVNLHSDDNMAATTPRALKAARDFTEAFDYVFYEQAPKERGIRLRDVLKLDKSVDEIVESKKTAKAGQDDSEKASSLEHWIETHTVMGCLICYSNSCEHGDYSLENHKRNFSMDCIGMYGRMFSANRVISAKDPVQQLDPPPPCKRQCFRIHGTGDPLVQPKPWTKDETLLLRSLFTILDHNKVRVKAQCATAELLDRDCYEVHRYLRELDIKLPDLEAVSPVRVKNLPWYDRKKKMLVGDWQEQTNSHDTKVRPSNDPCHHDGPCTAEIGCPCVLNNILCERFCRCTEDCCAYKFTGCACHASGKTCLQKQKEGRPCICVQLNRECDPDLCGTCGAAERADPANRDDDELFQTGCQNTAIQRGVSKAVILGQSQLEGCGYGLFTAEDISQDEFVIEYRGELIVADEGVRREARRGEAFATEKSTSYVFSLLDYEGIWVDAAIYGNLSRYINHAVEAANVQPSILYVNGEYRIRFSATRSIKAGEELFFNYGANFPNLTKKMIKEKADNEEEAADGAPPPPPPPSKRGRGGRRPREKAATGKPAAQTLTKSKIAKSVRTGARKEAPKLTADDYEALVDFEVPLEPPRKRKRAAKSDDEEEEYHPPLSSEENPDATDNNINKRRGISAKRHVARRAKSGGRNMPSDSDEEDFTHIMSPPSKRGRTSSRTRNLGKRITSQNPSQAQSASKGESSTTPQKKRRGRPPKHRPEEDAIQVGNKESGAGTTAFDDQEADGGTIAVDLNSPKPARERRLSTHTHYTGPRFEVMDEMEIDDAEVDVSPTRSKSRRRRDENTITARGTPRTGGVSASRGGSVTRSPTSQRRTQRRALDVSEVNDSEASFQNAESESDQDVVDRSLVRSSRIRKTPARYRSSESEF